jgi:hypothetical protein
VGRGQGDK